MSSINLAIDRIRAGSICASDILDRDGRVLIGRGVRLTPEFLQELKNRGFDSIGVSPQDLQKLTGGSTVRPKTSNKPLTENKKFRVDRSSEAISSERHERFSAHITHSLKLLENLGRDINKGSASAFEAMVALQSQFVDMLMEDTDQSISAASSQHTEDVLASRSAQFAILSMATAIEMDLTEEDILLCGSCGLLHDIGQYSFPPYFRDQSQVLTFAETEHYQKHPEISANILAKHLVFGDELCALTLQVHELPDGSGYPRGILRNRFHRLTSLVGLVNVYLALVNPTSSRAAMTAYDAITLMLLQCRTGLLDSTVMRAFMNQCSLYGLGSKVVLDTGAVATVVRRDADLYDQPVVALDDNQADSIIRLRDSGQRIKRAVRNKSHLQVDRSTLNTLCLTEMLYA